MERNKAVIYARYSSDKQTEQSIEGQIRVIQEYAERKGIVIIGQYVDRALSGRMDARPDFQRMIRDSKKRLFDFVIVYQFDRFARDKYDSANYKHILKNNGVKVLSAKEDIPDDPAGIMLETMLEGMAEYFSAELSIKVKRGMNESFLKGNYLGGGLTYGYKAVSIDPNNPKTKRYEINEKEAEVIRKIFNDYVSGIRSKDIMEWLDKNNIRSNRGKKIVSSSLMHILGNEKYIGTLGFSGKKADGVIPAIVDKDIFMRAQARLEKNRRKPAINKAPDRYILSGKLHCALCKALMVADSGKSKTGTIHKYYKCSHKKRKLNPCTKKQIQKSYLENLVIKAVIKLIMNDEALKLAARQIVAVALKRDENTLLMQLEKQLAETQVKIDNMLNAIMAGIITADTKSKMVELEATKADLLYRIDGEKLNSTITLTEDEVLFWLLQFRQRKEDDKQYGERLIDTFVNKIIAYDDKIIIIFNIKGVDGNELSIDEIISEIEKSDPTSSEFGFEQYGAEEGI